MTIKEAILKSLEEIDGLSNHLKIYEHIKKNSYYIFKDAKTPESTISSLLGDFIRKGDNRVKRVKQDGGTFSYYLTKNEQNLDIDSLNTEIKPLAISTKNSYMERDLHKLLSSYLHNSNIYSKTIFHEQSNGKDNSQIWTHPDIVGIKFLNLQSKISQNFLKSINRVDTFKIYSYELKKEINNDTQLKQAYFQAVSNSSWSNYGYLVAFDFSDSLFEEMERLNQSFGIGIIELNANPWRSKVLFTSRYKELDFKTIDKLCKMNKEFESFIEYAEKIMTADEKYFNGVKKEFNDFCDEYLSDDSEVEKYCNEKHIPFEDVED